MNLHKVKYFPLLILISALLISISSAYCSVIGFMRIFAGSSLIVGIICSTLELGKIIIAASLQKYWNHLIILKKIYLFIALFILIIITSAGIYGFLSSAYQSSVNIDQLSTSKIESFEYRKTKFEEQRNDLLSEKKLLDNNYSDLSKSFNNTLQNSSEKNSNKLYINSLNSRNINKQLNSVSTRKENISNKINILTDSVNNIDQKIITFKSSNKTSGELSSLKYISNLTGQPIDKVVNIFICLIIFVFDPLALMMVTLSDRVWNISTETIVSNSNVISEEIEEEPNSSVDELIKNYTTKKKKVKSNPVIQTEEIPIKEEVIVTEENKIKENLSPNQVRQMSHQEV